MDACLIFINPNGTRKVWCIDRTGGHTFATYWGALGAKMQSKEKFAPNQETLLGTMKDLIQQKLAKGYIETQGFIDEDNRFHFIEPQQQEEPTPDFDLTKILNKEKSFFF